MSSKDKKSLSEYVKEVNESEPVKKVETKHPTGFEPGIELNGKTGFLTQKFSQPVKEEDQKWDDYLIRLGFDPDKFEIVQPIEVRSYDGNSPEGVRTFWYYKAKIRSKGIDHVDNVYDELVKDIKKFKPKKTAIKYDKSSFCVNLADWQIGKADGGGSKETVARIQQMKSDVTQRILDLRKLGIKPENLYVFSLGDIIESCDDFYPQQTFTTDLNLREQINVARQLIVECLKEWVPMFKNTAVAVVAGNHGEVRKNGKSFTEFGDNYDLAIFDQIKEIFAENKSLKNVKFSIPKNDLHLTLNVSGKNLALVHGHQFRTGGRFSFQKAIDWTKNQKAFSQNDIKYVDIVLSGHFHHFFVVNEGRMTFMQMPSVDGGSYWFESTSGKKSYPGTVTFVVGEDVADIGWDYLKIV